MTSTIYVPNGPNETRQNSMHPDSCCQDAVRAAVRSVTDSWLEYGRAWRYYWGMRLSLLVRIAVLGLVCACGSTAVIAPGGKTDHGGTAEGGPSSTSYGVDDPEHQDQPDAPVQPVTTDASSHTDTSTPTCIFDTKATTGTSDSCLAIDETSCPSACGGGTWYGCSGAMLQPLGLTCRVLQVGDAGYPMTCCTENQCVRYATLDSSCKKGFAYSCAPGAAYVPPACTSAGQGIFCCP